MPLRPMLGFALLVSAPGCAMEAEASGEAWGETSASGFEGGPAALEGTEPESTGGTELPTAEGNTSDGTGEVAPQLPHTALPLQLLATMAGDPQRARATIRNASTGVIASYGVGDSLSPLQQTTIEHIDPRRVVLDGPDGRSRLDIPEHPVALAAGDTYYPDLDMDDGHSGSMADAVQMQPGPGYVVKAPAQSWGTPKTVVALQEGLRRYVEQSPQAPQVVIGDLSKPQGGPFRPHISHRAGRDVDIGYVLRGRSDRRYFALADRDSIDLAETWRLLEALMSTDAVSYVFMDYDIQHWLYDHAAAEGVDPERLHELFQYPRGPKAAAGLIRHWKGHEDHFHVRFEP